MLADHRHFRRALHSVSIAALGAHAHPGRVRGADGDGEVRFRIMIMHKVLDAERAQDAAGFVRRGLSERLEADEAALAK